ncbi:MAG: integration host factor subunit alpha [Persicimonas sp.]
MTMTKAGLVDTVYESVGVTKKEASDYVDTVLETIKETLEEGDELKISGFGKFEVRHKGERVGRNPRTGVEIMIPERKVLRFKVSQVLKDELNGDLEE